jgi:hypothetical protein
MNTYCIDTVEDKIKIEHEFRYKTERFIRKMYKTRENSILPHDVNTEDVFDMLQDLTWTGDDKFVVFFNFEFVLCLMKLGVTPNRITFIAPSKESFYVVRDGGWGARGMKSILFDLSIYKRYQNRKQWKSHLMKKIGKLDEFIGVGNIPFTVNSSNSTFSKQIGNDFILLMKQFKQSCYILPAKFDRIFFREEVMLSEKLKKIVYHKRPIFDIAKNYYTCHVVVGNDTTDKFVFQDNISKSIELKKDINLQLSREIDDTFILDSSKKPLGFIWIRGNENDGKLKKSGKYKVVSKVGKDDDTFVSYKYSDTETTGLGKWKVVMANVSSGWVAKVVPPEYSICFSIIAFPFDTKEAAESVKEYLMNPSKREFFRKLRTSDANTKTLFDKIPLPDGLI